MNNVISKDVHQYALLNIFSTYGQSQRINSQVKNYEEIHEGELGNNDTCQCGRSEILPKDMLLPMF